MNAKKPRFLVLVLGVLLGLSAAIPQPLIGAFYWQWPMVGNMEDLGVLGIPPGDEYSESFGTGVNDSGQVVGYSGTSTANVKHGFLWTSEQGMTDLGTAPDTILSYPSGINNNREICVNCFVAGWGTLAYLNSSSGWTQLERKAGWSESRVYAINRDGIMVGTTHNPEVNRYQPCRWSPSGAVEFLGDLGSTLGGEAYGINGSGWVVGKAYSPTDGAPHAFLWKGPGQMIDLGAPTGCGTIALGVNDGCYVVGYVIDSGGRNYSVMWPPSGTMEYLGSFPGGENEGQARAINNNNEITGTARGIWDTGLNKFEVWHAFLYRNGQMLDLGTTSKNPLQSSNGSAINSRGQVAGYGNRAQQPWGPTEAFFCSGLSIPMEGAVLLLLD